MEYPARILAVGSFSEQDIEMMKVSAEPLPPDAEERIRSIWGEELKQNPHLYSGPMLAAQGIDVMDGARVRVRCMDSEYKYFMGTTHEEVFPLLRHPDFIHRAIGFLAVTITSDGYAMLGVRSPRIDWPTLRHIAPAGRLTPQQGHPFPGIRAEFREELGLEMSV